MKFLADMGISPASVAWLNQQGHDAKHLSEERLHKLSDREIFDKADKENRVVLTTDLDFGEIAMSASSAKNSVIIFRQEDRTPASINQYLEKVIYAAKTELEKGVILTVQEGRFRIRHLK
jgi:predicted nuclease of predicted toxin-antitoxin system